MCLSGVLSAPRGAMIRTIQTERGVTLADSMAVAGLPTVTGLTEIEDTGEVRTITYRSVATFKPRDVERLTASYSPCL
ncbi:hypothetical protein EDF56_106353 [Novosphingobium sp. PhB165]|nr:hypothetical protein EDF56_106353 [Novosphingobium sp. PhB165]